jgi:Ca2+-binding RTX toxin-like protein
MASQVGKAGDGPGPVVTNTGGEGVEEVKSQEAEKKSAEPQKEASKNEVALPYRATAKEASNRKAELGAGGASQKSTLNRQLDEKKGATKKAEKPPDPIVIKGTSGDDNIHVSKATGLVGKLGLIEVDVNGSKQYLTPEQAKRLSILAGAGNDTVVIDSNVKQGITVDGGSGNDVIIGGAGDDKLSGGTGNDVIAGRGGNDIISGGRGNDFLMGGTGNDVIDGGSGKDSIRGGAGNDVLRGGRGDDVIHGEGGNDFIAGGSGNDVTSGGAGFDIIIPGAVKDKTKNGNGK